MAKNGVLVVTGGSRGIGAAVSLLAAERGFAVVVNYTSNVAAAEHVTAQILAKGGEAIAVRGDVGLAEDVEHIFAAADRLGKVTGLVNNAGMTDRASRVEDMTAERINRVLAVNVTGSFLCAAAAVKRMSTRHGGTGGAIVNLASGASKLGGPGTFVDYAAAKGAIDSFTIGLALEVAGEGVRVNAVRPGLIDTEFHDLTGDPDRVAKLVSGVPIPRAGTALEVAYAILWLLSPEAAYSTGTTITVSGGRAI